MTPLPPALMRSFADRFRRAPGAECGFTLVEMLVVLLIVGLLSGLLFDGATQLMAMQARLNRQLKILRGESLRGDWLRQVVQGLQPDYPDGTQIFKGSPYGFSGLTTDPLSGDYGALQAFAVTVTRDAATNSMLLRYESESNASILLSGSGDLWRLRYIDGSGHVHEDWPPPAGRWPQLPSAITLELEVDGQPWLIAAAPFGPARSIPRPRDIMGAGATK